MLPLPKLVIEFMDTFRAAGFEVHIVGGCVRDLLIGQPTNDWDFTTNAIPNQIQVLFPDSFYNNSFGTVGVPVEDAGLKRVFEVTTYRTEKAYGNNRHPDEVTWSTSLDDDLTRRDFTINAIAYDGEKLTDLFNGQDDLKNGVIRAVGTPDERFKEDALRLMRAIRFATRFSFIIEEHTHKAIKANANLINNISGERIRDEFLKIISYDRPDVGVLLLRELGILEHILPEVNNCFGVEQKSPGRHHIYDVGTHLVKTLRYCASSDPITRFGALLHDIGKRDTFRKNKVTGQITFYNHEVVGKIQTEKIAARFKLSNAERDKLVRLVEWHMFSLTEEQTDKALRRFIRNVGVENIDEMIALRIGDRIGSGAKETSWRLELFKKRLEEVQQIPFCVSDLKITGHDVMEVFQIKPSRQIGDVLDKVFEKVENKELPNEREALLAYLHDLAKK